MAVGEVASVREIHPQDDVARLQRGHVHGHVCLRAGMRLNIGVLRAEKLLGAVNGELLDLVCEFTPAVVASARLALGVFVCKD